MYRVIMLREHFFTAMATLHYAKVFIFSAGSLWVDLALNSAQVQALHTAGISFRKEQLTTA